MKDSTHNRLTWLGCTALVVAVALPLMNYFFDYSAPASVIIVVGVIGAVLAGSRRVESVGVKFIKAWRGTGD